MQCQEQIRFINGDNIQISFTVYKNEKLISLDNAIIRFLMSYYGTDELILEKSGIRTGNLGEFTVDLIPDDTKGYEGIFDYQIEITDIKGKINTTETKQINIKKKITA